MENKKEIQGFVTVRDCMETVEYGKELKRMCEYFKEKGKNDPQDMECADCPLDQVGCDATGGITMEQINKVQEWSEDNPIKTKMDAFFDLISESEFRYIIHVQYGELRVDENAIIHKGFLNPADYWDAPAEERDEDAAPAVDGTTAAEEKPTKKISRMDLMTKMAPHIQKYEYGPWAGYPVIPETYFGLFDGTPEELKAWWNEEIEVDR